MEHLSPEWIAAFDEVVHAHPGLRRATADRCVVIAFTVGSRPLRDQGDEPDPDEVAYALVFDHGENRVVPGAPADADITLRTDRSTAAAIAAHAESAQSAFMTGRLRLGGDVRVLIANQDALAEVDDCAAALRQQTDLGTAHGAVGA